MKRLVRFIRGLLDDMAHGYSYHNGERLGYPDTRCDVEEDES